MRRTLIIDWGAMSLITRHFPVRPNWYSPCNAKRMEVDVQSAGPVAAPATTFDQSPALSKASREKESPPVSTQRLSKSC